MSLPRYEAYRDSGVDWLGEVPAHWGVARLRFLASLNPSKAEIGHYDEGTEASFLPMEAVGDDGSLRLDTTRPIGTVQAGYTYFANGDVTFAKITPCFENGKGALMQGLEPGFGFGTTELTVLRPIEGKADGQYLYWLTDGPEFRKLGEAAMYGAGGQKRVPDDFARNFEMAFPPLPEQRAIAAYLDRETGRIDRAVAEQRRLIALLAEKRQATISYAVTKGLDPTAPLKPSGVDWLGDVPAHWEVLPIRALAKEEPGAFTDGDWIEAPFITDEGVRLVQTGNIGVGVYKEQGFKFVSEQTLNDLNCTEFNPGDVLICRLADPVGRACLAPNLNSRMITSVDVCIFKPGNALKAEYFNYLAASKQYLAYMESQCRGGTRDRVSRSFLGSVRIPVPPLTDQETIARHLKERTATFDALTTTARSAIDLLLERRAALVSAAVTGKIDVRGLVGEHELEAA